MDALLAGYGSDSEDSSTSPDQEAVKVTNECSSNSRNKQETQSISLPTLLGDGVDSCSSSDDEEKTQQTPKHSSTDRESPSNSKKLRLSSSNDSSNEINQKRNASFLTRNHLPSPRVAQVHSAQSESMVSWDSDCLTQDPSLRGTVSHSSTNDKDSVPNGRFQKFKELAAKLTSHKELSWATHIKNQQEFHNPHIFQSVIEQFGITDPLGSQVDDTAMTQ
mmetsp:Transcript_5137/g.14947  ORF Transcript_5137/g.14947 Transcript_5137/m.14947 type:complete len:220 (-) Transcript_5137:1849-2508(-)